MTKKAKYETTDAQKTEEPTRGTALEWSVGKTAEERVLARA